MQETPIQQFDSTMNHLRIGEAYIAYSRRRMMQEYLPKIQRCLEHLSDEDIWWRAHETDNSIGNLLLHLSGNIRQWIICGLGGAEDRRIRAQEYSERSMLPKQELMQLFEATLAEADATLERLPAADLLTTRHIQKWEVTSLDALSHVIEHISQHTGQIIYITKLRKAIDLKFYDL